MKKVIVLLVLLAVVLGVYFSFNGTPWGLYSVKQEASLYLQERYAQEMVITGSGYSLSDEHYYAEAHPKENPDLGFLVHKYKHRDRDGYWLSDHYPNVLWWIEMHAKLGAFAQQTFSEQDTVEVSLHDSGFHQQFDNKSKMTDEEVMTYRSDTERREPFRVTISVEREFDAQNADEEYRKIFDLVTFVKEKRYRVDEIEVCVCKERGSPGNRKFVIPSKALQGIETKEDIKSY